ncbi:MAG: hypothetical protein Q7U51_12900 [Methanoregula sp.]|nr:hypothetical protein [Methanoregula sp.]
MARNKKIPELLEQYLAQFGETEQWITVQEFRTYFQLDEFFCTGNFRIPAKDLSWPVLFLQLPGGTDGENCRKNTATQVHHTIPGKKETGQSQKIHPGER